MSDGGDGFGEVLAQLTKAKSHKLSTVNAAHRRISADWWWDSQQSLAIIESARIIGLAMLPEKKFHPYQLDTYGLEKVFAEAVRSGAQHCLIGIGGSATNDAGFGLAQALGWKFLGQAGRELDQWWQLIHLHRILPPKHSLKLPITVAVDVANPLLGKNGCSRVYGPQKGLQPGDVEFAEKCLRRLRLIVKRQLGIDYSLVPGAGAAGGLGYGLMAFAGAKLQSGFEVFAHAADLKKRIHASDLVITGEGALDSQTRMGKGVGQIGLLCRKLNVPCIAIAGDIRDVRAAKVFWKTRALTDIVSLAAAKRYSRRYLQKLSRTMAAANEY